jgi:hypothetical protein
MGGVQKDSASEKGVCQTRIVSYGGLSTTTSSTQNLGFPADPKHSSVEAPRPRTEPNLSEGVHHPLVSALPIEELVLGHVEQRRAGRRMFWRILWEGLGDDLLHDPVGLGMR